MGSVHQTTAACYLANFIVQTEQSTHQTALGGLDPMDLESVIVEDIFWQITSSDFRLCMRETLSIP
jgi:hypothetical protein